MSGVLSTQISRTEKPKSVKGGDTALSPASDSARLGVTIMQTNGSRPQEITQTSNQFRCWMESLILAFGIPTGIWALSKLITLSIPAAVHGSPGQRFLLSITGVLATEWLFVAALWITLRSRGLSLRQLGVWRMGTWPAWIVAVGFAVLSIGSNLRFLPRMNIPISYAFFPHGFHLIAALAMGITAGFCEEVLFRAFLMTEFFRAGYGKVVQVLVPGVTFGLAHAGFLNQGVIAGIGIMVPTAFLGMMWGIAYLMGRRGLMPSMIAHFLNDATALPWVFFFIISRPESTSCPKGRR